MGGRGGVRGPGSGVGGMRGGGGVLGEEERRRDLVTEMATIFKQNIYLYLFIDQASNYRHQKMSVIQILVESTNVEK